MEERSEAFRRFLESVQGGGYDHAALYACTPDERAQIEALLESHPEGDWDEEPVERIGPVRRVVRLLVWLLCLAILASVGWYLVVLASLKLPLAGVHAPLGLTIGSGLAGILLLLWFDGKWRRVLLLLLSAAALALCLASMRWVDASAEGVREHWSGLERGRARLSGDLCYRIDAGTFELRGANPAVRFVYRRGIWPSAFDAVEFKRYFFSDLPMRARADGWICIAR